MKPALFDYYDPMTEAETLALLAAHGTEAKILAGGQSLMPLEPHCLWELIDPQRRHQ